MMTKSSKDLSDVLYALALAMPVPDAKTLDEFVRRYPQYAESLTDFAVQLALDAGIEDDEEDKDAADGSVSPAVSRAISHFQNIAFELDQSPGTGAAEAVTNPLARLSRDEFRAFTATLGANSAFVIKLRDLLIEPDTIISRPGFCQVAADGLNIPLEAMISHLHSQPVMPSQQRFKADKKPAIPKRETFEEAVRNSGLTPEQQRRLLEL
jgi:hypothetical protein